MALIPIIVSAGKVAHTVYRHRKALYAVITAQDRYIKTATSYGRWSKSASYGWRSGAAAGSLIGGFITNNADDSPGNVIQTKIPKQYPSRPPYKTRDRRTGRSSYRSFDSRTSYSKRRCPSPRKRY